MSSAMLGEIAAAFDRAEASADIVVLRSGRPGIFSAVSISRCSLREMLRGASRWSGRVPSSRCA